MAPFYHKPENALKRAEELIAVGQQQPALALLHDVIMSKKARSTHLNVLEPIMIRFVDLCVASRKARVVREGIHQFKNITQNITVSGVENVIKHFITLSESHVQSAQAHAQKLALDSIEDLEAVETPESIILSTVSTEGDKERTDREVVTPWLKFLWEAYRIALDILRNNVRMEVLYQSIADQAFQFCLRYQRKTEFRRLSDLLRQHLATAAKYAHQSHSINLSDPDTLQRQLDTRFIQLNAATDLELWQEAFRSVEDIQHLMSLSKKQAKPFMMANYYDKLSKIFLVGENYLFHAAALNKYYGVARQQKQILDSDTDEKSVKTASLVLLSALSIPIISYSRVDPDGNKNKMQRLTNLVKMPSQPTRDGLLRDAISKSVLTKCHPEIAHLYDSLELKFHPLMICKSLETAFKFLESEPEYQKYIMPLREVIVTRVLQQLSQVYNEIQLDSVVKLCQFPHPWTLSDHQIEKFVMNGSRKGDLCVRIDHRNKSLVFERDIFANISDDIEDDGKASHSEPDTGNAGVLDKMRHHLKVLASKLQSAVLLMNPDVVQEAQTKREESIQQSLAVAAEEHKLFLQRIQLADRKKYERESEAARLAKEEHARRMKRIAEEQAMEKQRLAEEQRRREQEKIEAIKKQMLEEEQRKTAERLKGAGVDIKKLDIESMDSKKLIDVQQAEMSKLEMERANKLKTLMKRVDHLERAFRKEEAPLLAEDYARQKKEDKEAWELARETTLKNAKTQYERGMALKERLKRMLGDYATVKAELQARRAEELAKARVDAQKKIEAAKQKRREEIKKRKEDERKNRLEELKRRKEREEMERRKREEEEKENKIREEERKKREAEYAIHKAKQDEIDRKRMEREREIEEKLKMQRSGSDRSLSSKAERDWRSGPPPAPAPFVPPQRRTISREFSNGSNSGAGAELSREGSTSSSSGAYVPPWKRGGSGEALSGLASGSGRSTSSRADGDTWRRKDDGPRTPVTDSASSSPASARGGVGAWGSERPSSGASKENTDVDSRFMSKTSGGPPRIGSGSWRERVKAKAEGEGANGSA